MVLFLMIGTGLSLHQTEPGTLYILQYMRSSAYDPDPQKYADPRIRIQGVKYRPKTAKKNFFTPKT